MTKEISFQSTVKNGLPVMVDAEYENGYWYAADMRWTGRKGKPGKSVPASIFDAVTNNYREVERLNREAAETYASGWEVE